MQLGRKRPFNTILFDNIEKLQKRMKNKFPSIAYQIRWSVGDNFKNEFEFLEKHFSATVY